INNNTLISIISLLGIICKFFRCIMWTLIISFLPMLFSCKRKNCTNFDCNLQQNITETNQPVFDNNNVLCNQNATEKGYNELSSLLNDKPIVAVQNIFSRESHLKYSIPELSVLLILYFVFSAYCGNTGVSGGLLIPMIFIGGLYGRIIGRLLITIIGKIPNTIATSWINPGVLALLGSASFLSGVTRNTISLAIILVHISETVLK
ncbi:hypothetical protein A3Q56_06632, partial [Intoshia linei]